MEGFSNEPVKMVDFQQVLRSVMTANDALIAQNRALQRLLERATSDTTSGSANATASYRSAGSDAPVQDAIQTNCEIWEGIFSISATSSTEFMAAFYHWTRPETVQQVLSSSATWTSWSYAAAFPQLSKFLRRVSVDDRCHCEVDMDDLVSLGGRGYSTSYHGSRNKISLFWDKVKARPAFPPDEAKAPEARVSARLFKILDLSPTVLTALLGSTPRYVYWLLFCKIKNSRVADQTSAMLLLSSSDISSSPIGAKSACSSLVIW
jgi:hypothetical protein